MSNLTPLATPFHFVASDIRTATDNKNNPWFCAKDVCAALDIAWSGQTLSSFQDDWKLMMNLNTSFGEKETNFINEAGLYFLIFRSNKPKAKEFASWVCAEVLPALRQQGFYGAVKPGDYLKVVGQIAKLTGQLAGSHNSFEKETLFTQLRSLHNLIGQTMPDKTLLAHSDQQRDAFLPAGGAV